VIFESYDFMKGKGKVALMLIWEVPLHEYVL